ncbi:MAG: nucleotidyltransferase family protein [Erythrobacter sp.]
MHVETIDHYLAGCVANGLRAQSPPAWPARFADCEEKVAARIAFHGISLLLWEADPVASGWPQGLTRTLREEATGQSFWEESHRAAISRLLESLAEAGVEAVVLKGTALAYSLYPRPALRRRGDTDILVRERDKARTRRVFADCGFERVGDSLSFQEMWQAKGREGFDHFVDLHWRISASANLAKHLERGGVADTVIPLPALSRRAIGIDPIGNLVLVCMNRGLHEVFGYVAGDEKLHSGDRLIWAVDLHLICALLQPRDWARLVEAAERSGTAVQVRAGLEFARTTLGTAVPGHVREALARDGGARDLNSYISTGSAMERLRLDLEACEGVLARASLVGSTIAPGPEKLRERYPDAAGWPIAALRGRRLVEGLFRLATGRG